MQVTVASITGLAGMAQLSSLFARYFCLGPLTETAIADYCASKAAVISLHESLRYELDKRCVHRSRITE
jgi:NAD(P)-dependent dehydrogenase (short-subunit alcohol dehydrogenase family)